MVVAHIFETTCCDICKYLLTFNYKNRRLLSPVSIYFGKIKKNSQQMLYLYF